jgi:hypothetical protein
MYVTVTMTLKLKPSSPLLPFVSWDVDSPPSTLQISPLPSPPTSWLTARDMKLFGVRPLTSTSDIGLVKCKECGKPILRSFMADHAGWLLFHSSTFSHLIFRQRTALLSVPAERKASRANLRLKVIFELLVIAFSQILGSQMRRKA